MSVRLPELALSDYLDEMLDQATVEPVAESMVADGRRVLLPPELLTPAMADEIRVEIEAPSENVDTRVELEAPGESVDTRELSGETNKPQPEVSFPMQCLMFGLDAHRMSVPLIQLSGVVDWDGAVTRLPESPDWMLGLVKHRDATLRIVDSRLLLKLSTDPEHQPRYLLVLGSGNWAITCDRLESVVSLDHDDIQWRQGEAGGMVLGTIRESLSTLLNPPGISESLNLREPAGVEALCPD